MERDESMCHFWHPFFSVAIQDGIDQNKTKKVPVYTVYVYKIKKGDVTLFQTFVLGRLNVLMLMEEKWGCTGEIGSGTTIERQLPIKYKNSTVLLVLLFKPVK